MGPLQHGRRGCGRAAGGLSAAGVEGDDARHGAAELLPDRGGGPLLRRRRGAVGRGEPLVAPVEQRLPLRPAQAARAACPRPAKGRPTSHPSRLSPVSRLYLGCVSPISRPSLALAPCQAKALTQTASRPSLLPSRSSMPPLASPAASRPPAASWGGIAESSWSGGSTSGRTTASWASRLTSASAPPGASLSAGDEALAAAGVQLRPRVRPRSRWTSARLTL